MEIVVKLTLGKTYEEVNEEHVYDYPQIMTWLKDKRDTSTTT